MIAQQARKDRGILLTVYQVDPLRDRRWPEFLERHPRSTVFHTPGWLDALKRTYGYEPCALTTAPPGEGLTDGLVFCRINSYLTGRRAVSLPFSDHCEPLATDPSSQQALIQALLDEQAARHWKYIEVRPRREFAGLACGLGPGKSYCFHALDLTSGEKELFSAFHRDCTQRKIRRAEREKLEYREGRSLGLLDMFYHLFVMTRQRQLVPPQPFTWFQNLANCLGPSLQVRVAFCSRRPVASILTLSFRGQMVYKYGCSDPKYSNLGGTQWLFWKAIQEAKALGLRELDLGRSGWENSGLITFKDRLGGTRLSLTYWRYPKQPTEVHSAGILRRLASGVFRHMPPSILAATGRVLYRHFG